MSKILVIDDSEIVCQALRLILESANHSMIEAHDGKQGLLELQKESTSIDLCIVDLNLPMLTGFDVIDRARKAGFFKPMLTLTTEVSRAMRDRVKEVGATGWMTKPVSAKDLLETIDHLTQ